MAAAEVAEVRLRAMTPAQTRAHLQRTLLKALKMGLPDQVVRLRYGQYQVPSTTRGGLLHRVAGTTNLLTCTCEAYGHMPLCVHRAAVLLRRWQEERKEIVINEIGDVDVVARVDAATLAYPPERWDTTVPVAPTLTVVREEAR